MYVAYTTLAACHTTEHTVNGCCSQRTHCCCCFCYCYCYCYCCLYCCCCSCCQRLIWSSGVLHCLRMPRISPTHDSKTMAVPERYVQAQISTGVTLSAAVQQHLHNLGQLCCQALRHSQAKCWINGTTRTLRCSRLNQQHLCHQDMFTGPAQQSCTLPLVYGRW
jgi:hypothetical protein